MRHHGNSDRIASVVMCFVLLDPVMHDDFSKYELMKAAGSTAEQVWLDAIRDKHDMIARIRLIRAVFSLSMVEAKEVWVRAEGLADSLEEHQERFIKPIEEWLLSSKHP
jgi:hypothetical protein